MSLTVVADIGTYSTKVMAGELKDEVITALGVGKGKSKGVKNGRIANPDKAGDSLKEIVERVENMTSQVVHSIHIGVGPNGLNFSRNEATVTINSEDRIVRRKDVARLKDLVRSVEVGTNEKIITTIPREFRIDGHGGVSNPVELKGRRLDMAATIVTIKEKLVSDFIKTTIKAGLELAGLIPTPLCTGKILLSDEERTRGKAVIDFGMEVTKFLAFKEDQLTDQLTFQLGGRNLTNDLSARLNVTEQEARRMKHEFGISGRKENGKIPDQETNVTPEEKIHRQEDICSTLSARTEEIFEMILSEARESSSGQSLKNGIRITGGNARLSGLVDFLNDRFDSDFDLGSPVQPIRGIDDLVKDPLYGPVMGLLSWVIKQQIMDENQSDQPHSRLFQFFSGIQERLSALLSRKV